MNIQVDLTDVVSKVLITILLAVLSAFAPMVWQWVRVKTQELGQELGERRFNQIRNIVKAAVFAAEQYGLTDDIKINGAEKKSLALSYIQDQLDALGLKVDVGKIAYLIETTVLEQFNLDKALETKE